MNGEKISYLSILYLIGWFISPPLASGTIYRAIAIVAVLCIVFFSLINNRRQLVHRFYGCAVLCLYIILLCFVTGESFSLNINILLILITSAAFALWNNKYGNNTKQLKNLTYFAICLYCIWNTTTLIAVDQQPNIMRLLAKNSGETTGHVGVGVGGYGYLYSVIIMFPIGIYLLKEKQKIWLRAVIAYFVISTAILAYQSQYFIALILAVLAVPMMVIANRNRGGLNVIFYTILAVVLLVIFANLESILDFCINIVDIPSIQKKLTLMKATLMEGSVAEEGTFGERYERYTRDLNLIMQNPVLGVFRFSMVGKHSTILDFFAQYGIPLGIVFVNILFSSCRDWIKQRIPAASVVFWITLILAIMNPLTLQVAAPLCVVLPTFCKQQWLKSRSSITRE